MSGYVKLHRKMQEHWIWQDPEKLRAWLDLILMAAWKPQSKLVGGKLIPIPRGGLAASERYLSARWKWSTTKVRKFLHDLALEGMIIKQKKQGLGVLTLLNYESYNEPSSKEKAQNVANEKQTESEIKKVKKGEEENTHTHALPNSNGSLGANGDGEERASGAFDEPMNSILRAAGFRRPHWSASEYAEFAAHPQLLTDPEAVSTIVGAVGGWKTSQESGDGRRVPVSAKEIGRRLPEIWDWADARPKARPSTRNRYQTKDDLMKP